MYRIERQYIKNKKKKSDLFDFLENGENENKIKAL